MAKPTRSFSIDQWVLDLSGKLGINRSKIAQEALILEIQNKLQSQETDIKTLQDLAAVHFSEEKRHREAIQLQAQRRDQDEYVRLNQDRIITEMINLLIKFCAEKKVRPDWFSSVILGNSDSPRGYMLEQQFIGILKENNLPADLNIIRPSLLLKVPVIQ
jgi:hypothetical protein